jgi:hypothetical protein
LQYLWSWYFPYLHTCLQPVKCLPLILKSIDHYITHTLFKPFQARRKCLKLYATINVNVSHTSVNFCEQVCAQHVFTPVNCCVCDCNVHCTIVILSGKVILRWKVSRKILEIWKSTKWHPEDSGGPYPVKFIFTAVCLCLR